MDSRDARGVAALADHAAADHPRRKVLVGFDSSAGGRLAVEQAVREADWRGWPLRILRIRVPARELVTASRAAGLVVIGRGLVEPLDRSVAARVAAPVLIVPTSPRAVGTGRYDHSILVGVDGSPAGDVAFAYAVAEARLRGVGILAVPATAEPTDPDPLRSGALAGFDTHCMGVPVRRYRAAGDPRRVLADLSVGAGAVVVGAGGSDSRRIGSVARALLRRAGCPLFIVHETDTD